MGRVPRRAIFQQPRPAKIKAKAHRQAYKLNNAVCEPLLSV